MKRGQIYAPGGYLLDCMDCDEQVRFYTEDECRNSTATLQEKGWFYYRGWHCPVCAKESEE